MSDIFFDVYLLASRIRLLTFSSYASWVAEDVTMVEFPKWQAIIVIEVGQDNVDIKYQLFYTPKGILLKTRNVSYMYDILGPGTFL